MRILHVNKFLYRRGGAESYLFELADMQRDRGDEVAFFGRGHPDNIASEYERHFPRYLEFGDRRQSPVDSARVAARMFWSTSAARGIREVLEDFKPDVVHHHNTYHQLSPSIIAEVKRAGVPQVMTLHDYKLVCPSYRLLAGDQVCTACYDGHLRHAVQKRCADGSLLSSATLALESSFHRMIGAYRHVDVFICPSEFLAEQMRLAGRYADRTVVVPNFVAVGPEPVEEQRLGFVYAGRIVALKGLAALVEAANRLPAGDQFDVTIVGDGPDRAALERMSSRARFVGHVDRTQVEALMEHSIASVLPARWHENQPMSVLESFERSTPVVATALGGLPELVRDGDTGVVVPVDDAAALAAALVALASEPERARLMGRRGRALVEQRHAPHVHLRSIDGVYDRATDVALAGSR